MKVKLQFVYALNRPEKRIEPSWPYRRVCVTPRLTRFYTLDIIRKCPHENPLAIKTGRVFRRLVPDNRFIAVHNLKKGYLP